MEAPAPSRTSQRIVRRLQEIAEKRRTFQRTMRNIASYLFLAAMPLCGQVIIDTIAGGGSLDGMAAIAAPLDATNAAAVGPDGSIYFTGRWTVFRIGEDGVIHAVAGTGVQGFSGDGGPALAAQLWGPGAVTVDGGGNLYFVDRYRIRRVTTDGTITTIAGDGYPPTGLTDGPALSTPVGAYKIAADSQGNVFLTEPNIAFDGVFPNRIRRVSRNGMISLVAGAPSETGSFSDGIPATQAVLSLPADIAVDSVGDVTIVDGGEVLRQITPDGIIHTILSSQNSISSMAENASGVFYFSGVDGLGKAGTWMLANGTVQQPSTNAAPIFGADSAGNYCLSLGGLKPSPSGDGFQQVRAG
jgi:hypothetical protein